MTAIVWKPEPDEHDYPAAADYLTLLAIAEQINGDLFCYGERAGRTRED